MKKLLILNLCLLLMAGYASAQFEAADVTAYFTDDVLEMDSTEAPSSGDLRKIEIKVENIEESSLSGCSIELVETTSDFVVQRKIGSEYSEGSMDFVSYNEAEETFYIDAGYVNQTASYTLLIRFEDHNKVLSDLITLTIAPYEN